MFMNTKIVVVSVVGSLGLGLTSCQVKKPAESNENSSTDEKVAASHIITIDAKSASALLENDSSVVVLDIRTPAEFAQGHIKDAINVDFKSAGFSAALAKLDKSKTYLMHCRSGGRSGRALPTFKKQQFTKIYHLNHGIQDWQKSSLPLVR